MSIIAYFIRQQPVLVLPLVFIAEEQGKGLNFQKARDAPGASQDPTVSINEIFTLTFL